MQMLYTVESQEGLKLRDDGVPPRPRVDYVESQEGLKRSGWAIYRVQLPDRE